MNSFLQQNLFLKLGTAHSLLVTEQRLQSQVSRTAAIAHTVEGALLILVS